MLDALNMVAQFIIPITGCSAIYLAPSMKKRQRMWAGILGLAGEPFWLATSIINQQWGIVLMALWFAYNHSRMYWNNRDWNS